MTSNIEALSEDEIATKLKSGELDYEEAYTNLSTRLYPFLLHVARHYGRDLDTAEDVVFDTLAQLPRFLESYKGKGSLRAYLLAVVRHRMIDHYRKAAHRQQAEEIESIHEDEFARAATQPNDESLQLIRELLDSLTEDERFIITARYIRGASTREIAEMLNRSDSSVRVKIHRAMRKLQELVTEKGIA